MLSASPRHLTLVLFEIPLAPLCPPQRQLHRRAYPLPLRRELRTLVECHDDVRTQADLRGHCTLGTKEMRRAIEMRTERYPVFIDLAQLVQAEDLEPAGVGQNGSIPRHEPV